MVNHATTQGLSSSNSAVATLARAAEPRLPQRHTPRPNPLTRPLPAAPHQPTHPHPARPQINATRIAEDAASFASCLISPDPGLACPLASELMAAGYTEVDGVRSYAPRHYVGVLRVRSDG